jgi:RNA polymerase sigma-70 factor, ECF subfamily
MIIFGILVYNLPAASLELTMPNSDSHRISHLMDQWGRGDERALNELMPLVYQELRRMARRYLRQRSSGETFQTTELIHETYLKLAGGGDKQWHNRAHFFGVAAKAMRHILVDHARSKHAEKRGGWRDRVSLDDNVASSLTQSGQVLALDEALKGLASVDKRKSDVVELKYFGGLTNEEAAEALGVSVETVKRDWRFARTWLLRELDRVGPA